MFYPKWIMNSMKSTFICYWSRYYGNNKNSLLNYALTIFIKSVNHNALFSATHSTIFQAQNSMRSASTINAILKSCTLAMERILQFVTYVIVRRWTWVKYAQKFAQTASRNFPKISPIMLLSVPITLALCSQVANNS